MKTHKIFNLVIAFVFAFSLLGMPAPVLATSQASVQSTPFTTCADVTEIPQAECEALVALYNSTNGAGWVNHTDWLATDTPCNWLGIYCDPGHVTTVDLRANQLSGSIPPLLGNLTQLNFLRLSDNQLTGNIPVELGNLTQLTSLDIQDNQFTGSIPVELGNLTQLTSLEIKNNQFTGTIPVELGNLTQLQKLTLNDNQLTGSIPAELGNLTQLRTLYLGHNELTGNIPVELGNLVQLNDLEIWTTQLTGSIPAELGNLTQLTYLGLCDNQLSGNIPPELGNLTQLTGLHLQRNQLSGSIPATLGNLTKLHDLLLYANELTGSIPTELGNLTQLQILHLYSNGLTGSIPTELGNLVQLIDIDLSNNQLSGDIPAELGNLAQLQLLSLNSNQLSGGIPMEMGNLVQLTGLYLSSNQLSGEFPASITNLVNLTDLYFDCGLTSSDPAVIAFLNEKSPGWQCVPTPPQCQLGDTVAGTVFEHDGITSVPFANIQIDDYNTGEIRFTSHADQNGQFGCYLPEGDYRIMAGTDNSTHTQEYYNEAADVNATPLHITTGTQLANINFTISPMPAIEHFTFNLENPLLQDLVLRQAIALGTDRQRILNEAFLPNGIYGMVSNSIVVPEHWASAPASELDLYPFDPAQARTILEAAGWIDRDSDGFRENTEGVELAFTFKTRDTAFRMASGAIFQQNMEDIGIRIAAEYLPNLQEITVQRNFDIAEFAWAGCTDNEPCLGEYVTGSQYNYAGYGNSAYDTAIASARTAAGDTAKLPYLIEAQSILMHDLPILPLFTRYDVTPVTTPAGNSITVSPESYLDVHFAEVTQEGVTSVIATNIHPADLPPNFQLLGQVYDIGSNAQFTTAQACFSYDDSGLTPSQESGIRLFHLEYNAWVDVTDGGYPNTVNNIVCGTVTSFSPFAIMYALNQPSFAPFVVLGQEGVWLKENTDVISGDVAANIASDGPYLTDQSEVTIGQGVKFMDPASRLMGDTVYLKQGSQVYDVYNNQLKGKGQILGVNHTPLELPLVPQLPTVPNVNPGTQNFDLKKNSTLTLDAGSYGKLETKKGAVITFTGGVYHFSEWNLGDDAKVYFAAPTEIRIAGKLNIGSDAFIGPATGTQLTASDIFIYVMGENGKNGKINASPKAAMFGTKTTLIANVYAPNGTLWIHERSTATGAFFGKWVEIGQNAKLTLDNGWH